MSNRQRPLFEYLPPAAALAEWASVEPLINSILQRIEVGLCPDDVLTCIQTGRMQLWRENSTGTIGITEIQQFPQLRLMLIYMVAGSGARDWIAQGQQQLENFARASGCKFIEFLGRPGWERMARDLGYARKFIRMRKAL